MTDLKVSKTEMTYFSMVFHIDASGYSRGVRSVRTLLIAQLTNTDFNNQSFLWQKEISEGDLCEISNILVSEQQLDVDGSIIQNERIYAIYRTEKVKYKSSGEQIILQIDTDGSILMVHYMNFNFNGNFADFRLSYTDWFSETLIFMVGETKRFESSLSTQDFVTKKGFINMK